MGARLAETLATRGARVVLIARNAATLKERAALIKGSIPIQCDVTNSASVASATARIARELGDAPDILVNNAGIFRVARVEDTTPDAFREMLDTNLVGPFEFAHAFVGGMKRRKSGHIVTMGSIADRTIFTGNAAYSAAKFGVRAVHEVLREELRGSGVRATLISPAATDTEIWNEITTEDPVANPREKRPMLTPDDVVAAVLYALTQPERVNIDELRLSHS